MTPDKKKEFLLAVKKLPERHVELIMQAESVEQLSPELKELGARC